MPKFTQSAPIDKEIILDPTKVIMSKTDYKGVIQYANEYFMHICGYKEYELMGKPHNVIRHPDMPKVIFKFMWEKLHKGENIYAAVKNLTKDGSYYWVMTNFESVYDENDQIIAYNARRKAIPIQARKTLENLYKKLIKIEERNIGVAERYLYGFVENSGLSYNNLFLSIVGMTEEEYLNYFKKESYNTNIETEKNLLNIDFHKVEKNEPIQNTVKKTKTESTEDDLIKLKEDIAKLKKELEIKSTEKKGFFGRLFS